MRINSDSKTLAENKVLILYILSNTKKPISNDVLYSIVLSATELNYFLFEQFLLDLVEAKYVFKYSSDSQSLYQITEQGQNTLDLTLDILPGIIKLKVDTNFQSNIENFENERSIVAEFIPKSENEYDVTCKIIENNHTIFSIKTTTYSQNQAQAIVENWKSNAQKIYPDIINILTNNK